MSENTTPQGKGLAVGGFVLSLVGLIGASIVMGASYLASGSKTVSYIWVVLCIASVILSVMGMSKLGKTGGKKGLGIAGMIIGIVAVLWSLFVLLGLSALDAGLNQLGTDMQELNESMEKLENFEDLENL